MPARAGFPAPPPASSPCSPSTSPAHSCTPSHRVQEARQDALDPRIRCHQPELCPAIVHQVELDIPIPGPHTRDELPPPVALRARRIVAAPEDREARRHERVARGLGERDDLLRTLRARSLLTETLVRFAGAVVKEESRQPTRLAAVPDGRTKYPSHHFLNAGYTSAP